jgi:hypothetical protein
MKNRDRLSEKEIKALLTRLKEDQAEYPPDLLENRRARFLISVPAAGFVIGSKLIYKTILHGIQSTAAAATKVILLSVIGVTAVGTALVGYKQGWAGYIKDEINAVETMVAPANLFGTNPASDLEKTIAAVHLAQTIGPSQTPTPTPTSTSTPTPTPTGTFTPTLTLISTLTPIPAPDTNPVQQPNINPTNPPDDHDDNGNHYGQTPKPGKQPRSPSAP